MKKRDTTLDPRSGTVAGRNLHAVANSRRQAGDEHGESGAVDRLVHMIATLVTQAPDLSREGDERRGDEMTVIA